MRVETIKRFGTYFMLGILAYSLHAQQSFNQLSLADTQKIKDIIETVQEASHAHPDSLLNLLYHADSLYVSLHEQYHFQSTLRFFLSFEKARLCRKKGDLQQTLAEIQETLLQPDLHMLPNLEAKFFSLQGYVHAQQRAYGKAKNSFLKGLSLATHWNTQLDIHNNLGATESIQGRSAQAIKHYKKALKLFEQHREEQEDQTASIALLGNIGRLYNEIDSLDLAERYFAQALQIAEKTPENQLYPVLMYNYALVFLNKKEYAKGYQLLDSTRSLAVKNSNQQMVMGADIAFVRAAIDQDCYNPEIEKRLARIEDFRKKFSQAVTIEVAILRAKVAMCSEAYRTAINYLSPILQMVRTGQNTSTEAEVLGMLATALEAEGNTQQALDYFKQYHEISDSLKTNKETEAIDNLKLEMELREAQIQKERVAEKLLLTEEQSRLRLYLLIVSCVIVLLVIFAMWIIARQRNKIIAKSSTIDHQNQRLKHLFSERQTFIKLITHDLRSPLMQIQLNAGSLDHELNQLAVDEETSSLLKEIQSATRKIDSFSRKILEASVLEANAEQVERGQASLNQQLAFTLDTHRDIAARKGIYLQFTPLAEDRYIQVNLDALQLILNNLLSNAIKYSPPHSTVEIAIKKQEGTYIFEVKDQGPGFTKEDFSRLYQRLTPLSAKPTGGETAIGMGLYLSYKLAQQIGVKLSIENHPTGGAIAKLILGN